MNSHVDCLPGRDLPIRLQLDPMQEFQRGG